jgi:hypothetical protein
MTNDELILDALTRIHQLCEIHLKDPGPPWAASRCQAEAQHIMELATVLKWFAHAERRQGNS